MKKKDIIIDTPFGKDKYSLYIYQEYITDPCDCEDGIHIDGQTVDGKVLIKDCIVDFSKYRDKKTELDENMSFVNGARVDVVNCIIRNGIKGMLIGSGDNFLLDQHNHIRLCECIIENIGRRAPELQDGSTLFMTRCLISNWGDPDWFDTRSFGLYAHNNSKVYCDHTIFMNRFHIHNLFCDIINHIGNTFNCDKDPDKPSFKSIIKGLSNLIINPLHALLPGVCRGITLDDSSECYIDNCYSPWWIRLEGKKDSPSMNKEYRKFLLEYLNNMKSHLEMLCYSK